MKTNLKKYLPKIVSGFSVESPSLATLIIVASALAFSAQPVLAAKHAAKVIYAFGQVKADGKSSPRGLKKGDLVYSGETVSTIRGRAQIKFTDGGFASLQPNTDYEINDYKFEGKADGKERSFLSLLKGSVRLVTGVIGKANRKNFRIRTAVATIGIRGTQGTLTHDPLTNITELRGHGGEWDLKSGSFLGPVPDGQAYSCDGVSCAKIAGTKARTEVARGSGRKSQRKRAYQQGQQTDPEGQNCDLGGACDELAVKIQQVGAIAATEDDGEGSSASTDFLENLGVVTLGEKAVALVADTTTDDEFSVGIVATDIDAVRGAVDGFTDEEDAEFVEEANKFLDELDSSLLAALEANPATTGEGDAATTPDGLVHYERWEKGNVLIAEKNFDTGEIAQRLVSLQNKESIHIIYGDALESIPFSGTGVYGLTGATYPTAINGSSMGEMPTSGALTWNFGTATGDLLLPVVFDGLLFTIAGSLQAPDAEDLTNPSVASIFTDNTVMATYVGGGMTEMYYANVDGFLTGENGESAALAAGLTYGVDYTPNPFVGAAAFGLTGVSAFMPYTTIKYSLQFFDSTGMTLGGLANGDDQFPMGTPLSAFNTTFGDTFAQAGATVAESGSNAMYGVSWSRFTAGYTFMSGALPPTPMLTEPFHDIGTNYTTPDNVVTNATGTVTYTLAGATSPTLIYELMGGGFAPSQGTLTSATFSANFTTGTMDTITYGGTFPLPGSFALTSLGPVPINSGTSPLAGTVTAAAASCAACPLIGVSQFAFASTNAGGTPGALISSYYASGTGPFGALGVNGVALSTGAAP